MSGDLARPRGPAPVGEYPGRPEADHVRARGGRIARCRRSGGSNSGPGTRPSVRRFGFSRLKSRRSSDVARPDQHIEHGAMLLGQAHHALVVQRGARLDVDHQLGPGAAEGFEHLLVSRNPLAGEPGMDVAARVQGPDLGEGHLPDLARAVGGPVHGLVVHDHDLAVGGGAQVDLDGREPGGYRALAGGQRVLRVPGHLAAVGHHGHVPLPMLDHSPRSPGRRQQEPLCPVLPGHDREHEPRWRGSPSGAGQNAQAVRRDGLVLPWMSGTRRTSRSCPTSTASTRATCS